MLLGAVGAVGALGADGAVGADGAEEAPAGRFRAPNPWHTTRVQREDVRLFGRLALISAYSLILLALDDLQISAADPLLISIAAVLWLLLAIDLFWALRAAPRRLVALGRRVGCLLLLIAPLLIGPDLQWELFVVIVVAYVLELRGVAAGRAFAFSFGLVVFIGLLATFGMMLAERNDPASRLGTLHEAGAWSLTTLLRLPGFRPYQPVTSDGRLLTLVVGTCALLAASFFTAQIVNWIRGAGDAESGQADASPEAAQVAQHLRALTGQVEALRSTVESLTSQVQALAPPPPDPARVAEPDATEPTPPAPDPR